MSLARQLDAYINETGQDVFIEVEGKTSNLLSFISGYNAKYAPAVALGTEGIRILQDEVDKWGLEYRLYMCEREGAPVGLRIGRNQSYRPEYVYRINDMDLICELFELGYRIGIN